MTNDIVNPDTAVKFDNVSKTFKSYEHYHAGIKPWLLNLFKSSKHKADDFHALDNLSFDIKKGESVAFIGRNGAGKSTILSLIAGVISPTEGDVYITQQPSSLLELGAGFHFDLTGRENIYLYGGLIGFNRDTIDEKMQSIINFSELNEFIDTPIRFYSSGMMARLGFSVVAQLDPHLLIVDEVLAVGDQKFQEKCFDVIEDFKAKGVTIVLVSHSKGDVLRVCDRAIYINEHKIIFDGPAEEAIARYEEDLYRD